MSETKHVYQAIAAVMADLAKDGVGKWRNNAAQGYKFRGIDDMYNALAPRLAAHGLLVLPSFSGHVVAQRGETKAGAAIYCATVEGHFDLVSAKDGSCHRVTVFGEANDSADKASNKSMSAAYKYAVMQTFCIPTEGDNDADASHLEVSKASTTKANTAGRDYAAAIGKAANMSDLLDIAAQLERESEETKATLRPAFKARKAELEAK